MHGTLSIDTSAAVNIHSLDSYKALRRELRGDRYDLRPCDLNPTGVGADKLDMDGVERLLVSFGKNSPPLRLDFYVMSNLALPCDGLIGLPSLRNHGGARVIRPRVKCPG